MRLMPMIEDDPVVEALVKALRIVDWAAQHAFVQRLQLGGEHAVWMAVCRRPGIGAIQPMSMIEAEADVDALVKVLRAMDWVARHDFVKRMNCLLYTSDAADE